MYRAAIRGDQEAFEMIIRTLSRPLFAIAFGILQSREESEDAVQDTFLRAWKSRWRVREPEKFPAWISSITRHRAHDILRKRKTLPLAEQLREIANDEEHIASAEMELHEQVRSALATLPELYRSALALRYFEKMNYAAIEQTLGLSNGALRGILGRALALLRKRLKPALAEMH